MLFASDGRPRTQKEHVDMERLLLRPTEAADVIGIGRSKVYELLARGELPSIRIDGSIRVPMDELRQWIAQKAREGAHGNQ